MAGEGTFLKWKSKQHAKLYVLLFFRVSFFSFFSIGINCKKEPFDQTSLRTLDWVTLGLVYE